MADGFIVRRGGVGEKIGSKTFIEPGLIVEWFGLSSKIPEGWQLCDGTNNTPNLIDRFIVGAGDTYSIGNTGGSADAIVVSHNHAATNSGRTNSTGSHSHQIESSQQIGTLGTLFVTVPFQTGTERFTNTSSAAGSHTHTATMASTGESGVDKNLPPYYGLFYIIKEEE